MKPIATLTLCLGVLVAACGDDATGTTLPATATTPVATTVTPTTTALTTTTAEVTTTVTPTTAPVTSTTTAVVKAVASGSGCAPSGNTLPQGSWFGFIEGVVMTPTGGATVTFDLACYFDGAQAELAAQEDGAVMEDPPYVRNQNPKVFVFSVLDTAQVDMWMGGGPFSTWFETLPVDDGCSPATGYHACPLWVDIDPAGDVYYLHGVLPEWSGDGRD